ncbi:MAG: tetraacyldisaccharide 4'-kinase [Bacteroidota bacterium]|nr:tetraacyldisaccharide 4'-kinase [Bacteroidota bacterium]
MNRFIQILLSPIALLFWMITSVRNGLYDLKVFKSYHSKIPTIVVGNLQVGGTGKSPLVKMLFQYLSETKKVGILSRGYGRKTKGIVIADENATAQTIGDEPLMYFQNLKNAQVVVSESRENGLKYFESQDIDLVVLDDAFQHRKIQADVNMVLTDFNSPYYNDFLMPSGRLRESMSGLKRADIVIVTKCPESLSHKQANEMLNQLKFKNHSCVFFTSLQYNSLEPLFGDSKFKVEDFKQIIALSGIANSSTFIKYLETFGLPIQTINKNDHHIYQARDLQKAVNKMANNDVIITTEKDAVKLNTIEFKKILPSDRVFVLPVKPHFLFNKETDFYQVVLAKIQNKA